MKTYFLLLISLAILIVSSCQKKIDHLKEPGEGGDETINILDSITGTWNFISINAETQSDIEFNVQNITQKTTDYLSYTTLNNAGTITIDDSTMTSNGLTYRILSAIKSYTYQDGVLIDSAQSPINLTFSESVSTCYYKLIGTDSIYFPKGGFTNIAASRIRTNQNISRLTLNGNTLTLNQNIYTDSTQIVSGTSYRTIQTGTAVITLQR